MNSTDYNTFAIIISIISLSLSFILLLKSYLEQRRNIKFEVDEILSMPIQEYGPSGKRDCTLISLKIFCINKSTNPISINYFEVIDNNDIKYRCDLLPSYHSHRSRKLDDIDYSKFIEYTSFPKNIGACCAELCIIKIVIPYKAPISDFYVYTNHGARINLNKMTKQLLSNKSNDNAS